MDKLSKEAKGYQNSFRGKWSDIKKKEFKLFFFFSFTALGAAQSRIAETMQSFFEDAPPASFQHYQQAIQHMDTKLKSDAVSESWTMTELLTFFWGGCLGWTV